MEDLRSRLPDRASVLDLGCGCGLPVARSLAAAGHEVMGVDISDVQIQRARRLVPAGTFRRADALTLDLPPASLDAVVLKIVSQEFVPEGNGGHALFWARKPSDQGAGKAAG
ncbi:class I SAM-dependent methyltransferase [Nonomuraea sp. ZG12]|uniref:class I SAM-dependent methyltransferase n=1 Tax=Nonomuraea sp. ZG12 TaxID=3452207 RepID=UPI003F8CF004